MDAKFLFLLMRRCIRRAKIARDPNRNTSCSVVAGHGAHEYDSELNFVPSSATEEEFLSKSFALSRALKKVFKRDR